MKQIGKGKYRDYRNRNKKRIALGNEQQRDSRKILATFKKFNKCFDLTDTLINWMKGHAICHENGADNTGYIKATGVMMRVAPGSSPLYIQ